MNEADKQATCRNTAAQMKEVPLFLSARGTCAPATMPIRNTARCSRRR